MSSSLKIDSKEINNFASNPDYQIKLTELRKHCDELCEKMR